MSRPAVLLSLVALLLLASGVAGPAAAVGEAPAEPAPGPGALDGTVAAENHTPADPPEDVIGWENGYWHNETLDVNQSDGLDPAELDAVVNRSMARVEYLRGLEFEATVPVEVVSRAEFQRRQENRTTDPALRTFDNVKFEALFLINESADSIDVQNQNRGSNVLGLYNSQSDQLVIVSDQGEALELDERTLAHELMHALQDQHFNLSRDQPRTRDEANARNGLVEGEARLLDLRYQRLCQDGPWAGTCLSPSGGGSGGGDLANVGVYLMKYQPYSEGPAFVAGLHAEGGWEAVNAAYDEKPASTEQVIHPEKYRQDEPTNVTLVDRNAPEWRRVRPANRPDYGIVGEAAVFTMLWYPGYDSRAETTIIPYGSLFNQSGGEVSTFNPYVYDDRRSAGWDGDRLHVYANDANETAYVWRLVWDGPSDAREFAGAYRELLTYWGGEELRDGLWVIEDGGFADAFHVTVEGDTVTIVNAPAVEDLHAVRQTLEVTPTATASPTASDPPPASTSPVSETPGQPGLGPLVALVGIASFGGLLLWRRRA